MPGESHGCFSHAATGLLLAGPRWRTALALAMVLGGMLLAGPVLWGAAKAVAVVNQRAREGATLTDVLGRFKMAGDRATFYPVDQPQGYTGLENLNLERIMLIISESPEDMLWSVNGTITEFRGANYILITKAVLKGPQDAAEVTTQRTGSKASMPVAPGRNRGAGNGR